MKCELNMTETGKCENEIIIYWYWCHPTTHCEISHCVTRNRRKMCRISLLVRSFPFELSLLNIKMEVSYLKKTWNNAFTHLCFALSQFSIISLQLCLEKLLDEKKISHDEGENKMRFWGLTQKIHCFCFLIW